MLYKTKSDDYDYKVDLLKRAGFENNKNGNGYHIVLSESRRGKIWRVHALATGGGIEIHLDLPINRDRHESTSEGKRVEKAIEKLKELENGKV